MSTAEVPRFVFEGIKVLDVASYVAGPGAASILADFGADVIKIEAPGLGDPYRAIRAIPNLPQAEHNYAWTHVAHTKRGLALDLKTDAGQAVLRELAAQADVFITNSMPQVRERLGITYETLSEVNPRLVYASLTGYGETGPEANKPGFDALAYWARSGLADLVRPDPDALPAAPAMGMGDQPTASTLYGAIVTALFRRMQTGRGSWVTTSLLANGAWANAAAIQAVLCGGHVPYRLARKQARNALTLSYLCKDLRWFTVTLLNENLQWPVLAKALGVPQLLEDPRFESLELRRQRATELVPELDRAFAQRDSAEWQKIFEAAGLTVGVVARSADTLHDPQMRHCGALVAAEGVPGAGLIVDSPFRISGLDKVPFRAAPSVGEHSDEILMEHGFSNTRIAELRNAAVVA